MNPNDRHNSIIAAFLISASVSVAFVVAVTVVGELYAPLKNMLKENFGHHWVGKSVLSAVIFFALGFVLVPFLKMCTSENLQYLLRLLIWTVVLGFIVLVGFFVYEAFAPHHG